MSAPVFLGLETTGPRQRSHHGSGAKGQRSVYDHEADVEDARAVQRILLDSENIAEFLDGLASMIARRLLDGSAWILCSVTLLRDKQPGTVAASGPDAAELDAIQNDYQDGPCVAAAREHVVIRVGDVRSDRRWAAYHAAVAERGVRSILGVPFDLRGEASAALNIYSPSPGDFSAEAIELVEHVVREASIALLLAVRTDRSAETETNLRAVLASRAPIDLAVGVVMGQNRCTREDAVRILKTASNHRNVKLHDLAIELLGGFDGAPPSLHFDD